MYCSSPSPSEFSGRCFCSSSVPPMMPIMFLALILSFPLIIAVSLPSSSSLIHRRNQLFPMSKGSSLSVDEPNDVLSSPNGAFYAGFHPVGRNAYCFAIWLSNRSCHRDCIIWTANRDRPVNGKHSMLTLDKHSNQLILYDAGLEVVWSSTASLSSVPLASVVQLQLLDSGNLVLGSGKVILWQSFDHPTDTLLPDQKFTRYASLVSSRGRGNVSSGYYKLYFDDENILRLFYDGPELRSAYFPEPDKLPRDDGRSIYNSSRVALLDSLGNFTSSDGWNFLASDYGEANILRRLTLDLDGNIRLYSLLRNGGWAVSWQAIGTPCLVHGICGPNAVCRYNRTSGRSCSCAPGYERSNPSDWFKGCKPKFNDGYCTNASAAEPSEFIRMPQLHFYGFHRPDYLNYTLRQCKKICLEICDCKGFQFKFNVDSGQYNCFPKLFLMHGHVKHGVPGNIYFRLPRSVAASYRNHPDPQTQLNCSGSEVVVQLQRDYVIRRSHHTNKLLVKILLVAAGVIAGLEAVGVLIVWSFLTWTRQRKGEHPMPQLPPGFKRYSYAELKRATRNFKQEIGRGASGTVYRASLLDGRVAAAKRLNNEASFQVEDVFLAEVNTIGKLNHKNLIEMLGYCAEGKHRLLVYEYMEHGSLAENLSRRSGGMLDWGKRFDVAVGAARGLAYLHEECLEWVLHCDVKPQNILLDSNYHPKVADFGLSKILNRDVTKNPAGFSRIRGTRGYMAPEWVYNLPITSKVDVYSYGIVLLEMVTGRRSPDVDANGGPETENVRTLVSWLREKMDVEVSTAAWIGEIVDHAIESEGDAKTARVLVEAAVRCVAEDKDERPTMRQVVEMLERHSHTFELDDGARSQN